MSINNIILTISIFLLYYLYLVKETNNDKYNTNAI